MENNYPPGFVPAGPPQEGPIVIDAAPVAQPQQAAPAPQQVVEQPVAQAPGQAPEAQVDTNTLTDEQAQIPDLDDTTLTRALEVLSGGRLKSRDEFAQIFEAKEKLPTYEARLAELTAKVEQDPFASPVSRKINEMLASGATTNEIESFVRLQNVDPTKLDPLEAIRMAVKAENPEFDSALVDAVIAEDFGLGSYIEGEEPSALDKARLIKAQKTAVEKINSLKVASETPASVAQQAQQTIAQQQKQAAYQSVTKSIMEASKSIPIEVDGETIQFPVPQQFQTILEQEVMKLGMSGQWTLDEQGASAAKEMAKAMVIASHFPQVLKAATAHVKSKALREAKMDSAGPAPKLGHTPPTVQPPQPKTIWEQKGMPHPSELTKRW